MNESDIMREIQLEAPKVGARLFRNNVGLFDTADGRKIRTGLCVGSADLIGWTATGRFLAVEVKRPGERPTKEQARFLQSVSDAGGVGVLAHSVTEFSARMQKEAACGRA